jgi:hypothetical protein
LQWNALAGQTPTFARQVSYGSILTPLGVGLLVYGFGAFFQLLPGADLSSLMLIYGFPISVLGFALSYAQVSGGGRGCCCEEGFLSGMGVLALELETRA